MFQLMQTCFPSGERSSLSSYTAQMNLPSAKCVTGVRSPPCWLRGWPASPHKTQQVRGDGLLLLGGKGDEPGCLSVRGRGGDEKLPGALGRFPRPWDFSVATRSDLISDLIVAVALAIWYSDA